MAEIHLHKQLIFKYMPKGPKYKKGYTWRHHFDEWWDRRTHEWKVKLSIGMGIAVLLGIAGLFFWTHRWMERDAIVTEAQQIHQRRIAQSDKLLVPRVKEGVAADPQPAPSLELRSPE